MYVCFSVVVFCLLCKQKTAYEMRISDWSSDVCSSDLRVGKDNNLAVLRPGLAAEWDQAANGELTPYDVVPGSTKKVAWVCEKGQIGRASCRERVCQYV